MILKKKIGISYFPHAYSRKTLAYLSALGAVDVIEWTLDAWELQRLLDEDRKILDQFAINHGLIGHGVHYPLLSYSGKSVRKKWIEKLKRDEFLCCYDGISIHFGFSTTDLKYRNAPFPVPYTQDFLELGWENMSLLSSVLPCKLGIENLAFAFSEKDVEDQGEFIDNLLKPFNGYLLLDIHNIYCQSINFNIDFFDIIKSYPLNKVEEIHVSGGSWSEHLLGDGSARKIRRDTHDGRVPDFLIKALPQVLSLCPNVRSIILEQLPETLKDKEEIESFVNDFYLIRKASEECL